MSTNRVVCKQINMAANFAELINIPTILDGNFFKIESVTGSKVIAKCVKCVPPKSISGNVGATSNFVTHLTRVHPSLIRQYEDHRTAAEESKRNKRKDRNEDSTQPPKKQVKLEHFKNQTVTQDRVDKLVMNFIVGDICSLRMVESIEFRNLVTGLAPNVSVMSRKTLSKRISLQHDMALVKLKEKLASAVYVCSTADAWSVDGRGYLGVTAHWIECESLVRRSAALACCRLRGSHTYDVIADALNQVFNDFGLNSQSGKLVCCITDNGSNFVKAFREFGLEYGYKDGSDDEEDWEVPDIEELQLDSVNSALQSDSESNSFVHLPSHHPCSTHTLSLIAVTDAQKALNDSPAFKRIHNSTMAKCSAIWNSTSRSIKNCELVDSIVGRRFVKPCPTRWNSLYDSLTVLQSVRPEIKNICQAIGVAVLKDQELDFIDEYLKVLRPVAIALDRLQGDQAESLSFMGALLPTLLTVQLKLTELTKSSDSSTSLAYCLPLANVLLQGLQKRFGHLLTLEATASDYIIAAVSHPFFKLRWIPTDHIDSCRTIFMKTRIVKQHIDGGSSTSTAVSTSSNQHEDDFFTFTSPTATQATNEENSLLLEYASYLDDRATDLSMLHKYNNVKSVFLKYNTPIPSSAPVERLFSTAGLIRSAKRNRLCDKTFEQLLLLKANRSVLDD